MAAGSVMKDPASGTIDNMVKYMASSRRIGNTRAIAFTRILTSSMMGRLAATTMMANTNAGSVKLAESTYATAEPTPENSTMQATSTAAQTPNTASTSDNKCHMPACGPPLLANRAKTGTEKVWMTARAKSAVARYSMNPVICQNPCRGVAGIFARVCGFLP